MNTTYSEKGKWNELGKELERIVRYNNSKSKGERKSLSMLFKNFAEKHDTTASSTAFYYYNDIKPKLDEEEKSPLNIDESISNYANSVTTELRDPRNFLKVGETYEVMVTSIQDFGVFCKTKEGFEGLIHISEITGRQYVDMPEDYFYIGEKIRVKLKRIDSEGKVAFSTRALGGKEKVNPAFKDITKTKLEASPIKFVDKKVEQPSIVKLEPIPIVEEKPQTHPDDRDNIINFIKKYSDNNVSSKALADIDEMVANFGVFQTTISLMEVVRDLDISSFITNMTKEKLGLDGDSLRRS
jgi:predicted RNA-binding protein with RPS1 domain